mgnify:CR=1 FL=1
MSEAPRTTHFGFKSVREDEKASLVRGVFDSVAGRYDLMNDLMSGGVHRLWKDARVQALTPRPGERVLDVAGGTGDIARRILAAGGGAVIVLDINHSMLAVGRDGLAERGLVSDLDWVCGDAETLPLPDRSVDAYTIAFGLRNVTRLPRALAEARRVLRPGGRFLCLEFSTVAMPLLDRLYDVYSFQVLPLLGKFVAGDAESYQYLAESIRRFPDPQTLEAMMAEAGLERASHRAMSGGIVALHSGWRL